MNHILIYFLPSVIGLNLYLYLNKKNIDIFNQIKIYSILTLLSNLLCMLFDLLVNKFAYNLTDYIENNLSFAIKYVLLSIIINIILSFVFIIVKKHISISVEVKKNEKKNK